MDCGPGCIDETLRAREARAWSAKAAAGGDARAVP